MFYFFLKAHFQSKNENILLKSNFHINKNNETKTCVKQGEDIAVDVQEELCVQYSAV